jgi:hypothetical protein
VHPAYEYWGQLDPPPREVNRKVSREEIAVRVSQIYAGKAQIKKCPRAYSLSRPDDPVSPGLTGSFFHFVDLCRLTL